MTKAVFALVATDEQARKIIDHLKASNFPLQDISVLYPDRSKSTMINEQGKVIYQEFENSNAGKKGQLTTEMHSKAPEGGVAGAATGGVLGGSLGLLAGIGALAIPGLGPFIAAGPIMAALSGSAVGGSVGLFIGALIGSGIPEYEAKKYEAGLRQGNILISVHIDNDTEINRASEVMKNDGATDISVGNEKSKTN